MKKIALISIAFVIMSVSFWEYGSEYLVTYESAQIAGDKPYCIVVSSQRDGGYDRVVSRSQLKFDRMWARISDSGGSRGLYQSTDHALLVFEDPNASMNWSYRSMNFVHEPVMADLYSRPKGKSELLPKGSKDCTPVKNFIDTLL